MQIILKCGDCGIESDGFHASVDHMGECHPQYFVGDKQAICIFCLKVYIWYYENKWYLLESFIFYFVLYWLSCSFPFQAFGRKDHLKNHVWRHVNKVHESTLYGAEGRKGN